MKDLIGSIAIGIIIAAVFITTLVLGLGVGDRNREKVERMTELCINNGYSSWVDTPGTSNCIGKDAR